VVKSRGHPPSDTAFGRAAADDDGDAVCALM